VHTLLLVEIKMKEFNCDNCGTVAKQKLSQYNRKKRHFCSMACYAAFKRDKLPVEEHPRWEGGIDPSEARRRWYQKNKARVAAMAKERRLREINAGAHTEAEWQAKLAEYGGKCVDDDHSCSGGITKDHIIPLIMGGENTIQNLVPRCKRHNSQKWKRVALEFDKS
jgi:5-methylcytosine-specific restriction endonuclease McrA